MLAIEQARLGKLGGAHHHVDRRGRTQQGVRACGNDADFSAPRWNSTDSGSEFLNKPLVEYCAAHRITFTRARPYVRMAVTSSITPGTTTPATAGSEGICSWALRTSQHLGIARNILAARLKRLVEHGLLEKRQYEMHPPRFEYHLTRKGLDLQPVLIGLMQWGDRYVADASGGPVVLEHRACGHPVRAVARCEACGEPVSPRDTAARPRNSDKCF